MHPYLTHHHYPVSIFPGRKPWRLALTLKDVAGRWLQSAFRAHKRRKMIATFHALDDWILRDIGISRSDIQRVVESFDDRELAMVPVGASDPTAPLH